MKYDFSCIDKAVDKFFNKKFGKFLCSKTGRVLLVSMSVLLMAYAEIKDRTTLYHDHLSTILFLVVGTIFTALFLYKLPIMDSLTKHNDNSNDDFKE